MKVRGERECKACGTRWSYYETGSVECPSCGSVRSVGVNERAVHTDAGATLDLDAARSVAADEPVRRAAKEAADACREYVQSRGFVSGGDLLELDAVYVAAQELRHAATELKTRMNPGDEAERYFLVLLRGAEDGERPAPDDVPRELRSARGLAAAAAVRAYRQDVRTYLDERDADDALALVERLTEHEKRVRALDGDVPPADADALVDAANAVGEYVRSGDDATRAAAEEELERLG